jgi:hypothetical protein
LISVEKLVSDRTHYGGRKVMVEGYFSAGFEYCVLTAVPKGISDRGIWVDPRPAEWARLEDIDLTWITNRTWGHQSVARVRVVGVLEFNRRDPDLGVGHLNMCPVELVDLEYLKPVD